ncbi:MAG: hypothetical protein ACLRYY_07980 [Anaerobutyricum soehngenii]
MKEQLKKAKAIIEGYDMSSCPYDGSIAEPYTHEILHLGVRKILATEVEH